MSETNHLRPPSSSTHAIELSRVSKIYGSFVALRDVSLSLPAGSSVVLLGPNGAGKSTLLRIIAGLSQPTYGDVRLFGAPPLTYRGRVATLGHSTMLYDELTATENLSYLFGLQQPAADRARAAQEVARALRDVALDPANSRRLGEYSQGMRQRASLARALLGNPEILLLDEPFSNLDVASVQAMVQRLQQFLAEPSAEGRARTLLLTTHQAELARPLAGQVLTMLDGRLHSASRDVLNAPAAPPAVQAQGTPSL